MNVWILLFIYSIVVGTLIVGGLYIIVFRRLTKLVEEVFVRFREIQVTVDQMKGRQDGPLHMRLLAVRLKELGEELRGFKTE
jgi:hypothetical protein